MTLCVTFERYLVVCWPLRARHLCTVLFSPNSSTPRYLVLFII